jgi:hypothetical protein
MDVRTYFDHEKLDVYQLELRSITWVTALFVKIKQRCTAARIAEVSDQLDRASLSALLNTVKGNRRPQRRTRAKFFDDGEQLLLRIASMLTKLIERFDISSSASSSSSIIREEPDEEAFDDEDEDDNEDEYEH